MTKRDFFRLLIKVFGLYSMILSLFTFLPQNFTNIYLLKEEIWMLFIGVGLVLLVFAFFFILLFKTDSIIDKLELDKGFDDDKIILGDFKDEQLFKLAILLVGSFLIIDYFPNFIFEIINIFKTKVSNYAIMGYEVDYFNLFTSILNLVLGFILITNYKAISLFLDKK